jgi:hypothetical protein
MESGSYRVRQEYKVISQPDFEDLIPDRALVARLNDIFLWEESCRKSKKIVLR